MKLDSVNIINYRNFQDITIQLNPKLTAFIGINGSGKTTLLDAIAIFLRRLAVLRGHYFELAIGKNDFKIGKVNLELLYTYYISNQLYSYKITSKLIDNKPNNVVDNKPNNVADNKLSHNLLDVLDIITRPIVVYYSSKRIINNYHRENKSHSDVEYAFKNAFQPEIDFSSTLTWFIEKSAQEALAIKRLKNLDHSIPELNAVRSAVSKALGDYDEPYVDETPPQIFISRKDAPNIPLQLSQLSDGYRTMLALVMDLARRMALAAMWQDNKINNILEYPAIVLIDEVELHLHPAWQQSVLPTLLKIFPNTQFIVTTHSPQIISSIEPKHIRILSHNNISLPSSSTYGAESQRILEEIFGVGARYSDNEAKKTLDKYFKLLNKGEYDSEKANKYRKELDEWLSGDPALDTADMLIRHAIRAKERNRSNA